MKNKNSDKNKKPSSGGFRFWGPAAVAVGVLTGICILFWYTPRAYQPVQVKQTLYLTHELGPAFHNQVQLEKPFELIVSQTGLNEIIAQEFESEAFGEFSFSDPHIIFSDQSIVLMGTLAYKGISSVLSITAFPAMDATGKIDLNIQSVRLGMVPVTTLITSLAQKAFDDNRDCFEDDPQAEKMVQAIIRKEPFDPTFPFSTEYCEYQVRISEFSVEQGYLKLTLLPKEI